MNLSNLGQQSGAEMCIFFTESMVSLLLGRNAWVIQTDMCDILVCNEQIKSLGLWAQNKMTVCTIFAIESVDQF